MAETTLQQWLDDVRSLDEAQYQMVNEVRSLVRRLVSPVAEQIKYGGIVFSASGVHFGGVFVYQHHVTVEFSQGARIEDRFGSLEGGGKARRHIKLKHLSDITEKHLNHYLPLAVAAAQHNAH